MKNTRHTVDLHIAWAVAAVLAAALVTGCAATYTTLRQDPDFAGAKRKIQTIAILPPDVIYTRVVITGDNERVAEREQTIIGELLNDLNWALERKQYTVRPPFSETLVQQKKNMDFELQQLRTAYNEAAKQLYDGPATKEEASQKRVTLGPVVNPFASVMNADALLIVRCSGFEKSSGQRAKDATSAILLGALTGVMPIHAGQGGVLELALIDGVTGDVLWVNRGSTEQAGRGGFMSGGRNTVISVGRISGFVLEPLPAIAPTTQADATSSEAKKPSSAAPTSLP